MLSFETDCSAQRALLLYESSQCMLSLLFFVVMSTVGRFWKGIETKVASPLLFGLVGKKIDKRLSKFSILFGYRVQVLQKL